jgi:hypothetical protein
MNKPTLKGFVLVRSEDASGVSGIGIVAEGVQFHDGQCVLSWFGHHHSVAVYPSIDTLIAIHGHEGRTVVEWLADAGWTLDNQEGVMLP